MKKPTTKKTTSKKSVGLKHGFRSGLEEENARLLDNLGVAYEYEKYKLTYEKPAKTSKYTPDYILPNGIIIETKGRFLTADRQKHILIKKQYPDLDLRFVFSNPRQRISKQSKTMYLDWCERNGFLYAAKTIPQEWIDEPLCLTRAAVNLSLLGWSP